MAEDLDALLTRVSYYKNVWQTVTAQSGVFDDKNVSNVLSAAKPQLLKGILVYPAYTEESLNDWKLKYKFKDLGIQRLVHNLSVALNLHSCNVWNVLCNYLMFEYYGKVSDMKGILESQEYTDHFIENVWFFYTSERMYLLKSIRYVLENYDTTTNSFGKYVDVLVPDIYNSLLKQLRYLIGEINSSTYRNCISRKEWIDRNNREQLEVVLSLITAMKHFKLDMTQYVQMLNIFVDYNFAKQPSYFDTEYENKYIIQNIRFAEISACLVALLHCWDDNDVWKPHITKVEDVISPLFKEMDQAVLTLAWTTLQMTLPIETAIEAYHSKYHVHIANAFQFQVFYQMYEITRCAAIMNCQIGPIIRRAFYKLLEHVCDKFDTNGEVYGSKGSCLLLSELIKEPALASECLNDQEKGATTLYNTSIRTFPYDFASISYLYNTLAAFDKYRSKVLEYLLSMPNYTEEYMSDFGGDLQQVTLAQEYETQQNDMVFPKNTKVVLWKSYSTTLMTLKAPCNYFVAFKTLIDEIITNSDVDERSLEAVGAGYDLLLTILKIPDVHKTREIQQCIAIVAALLLKFTKGPFRVVKMVKSVFKLCVRLIDSYDDSILSSFVLHKFLPSYIFQHYNLNHYQMKECISVGGIADFIIAERLDNCYDLVLHYLELIHICMKNEKHLQKVQIPGLIYIINYIFTRYNDWLYIHTSDKHAITGRCLSIFFLILQKNPDEMEFDIERELYLFCRQSFMTNNSVIRSYLRVIQFSNTSLNLHMHAEPNWQHGKSIQVFKNVKLALSVFLILSTGQNASEENLVKSVFPSERERRNFLKIIAGYMQQTFDESIAELAVIILKKIAIISGLPMLSSLDMDYYQIQGLFLYKLRDPLVSKALKIAIVEFITACVHTQHGLTAALFNITYDPKGGWHKVEDSDGNSGESVTQFLIEYLINIRKSSYYLYSPLQASILNLLFNIWLHKKDMLIEDLTSSDTFWPTLIDPLLKTSDLKPTAYSQILNIVTLEIMKCKDNTNEKLKSTLKDMFANPSKFVTVWSSRLLTMINDSSINLNDDSPTVALLKDWKNFVIVSTKIFPDIYTDSEVKFCLVNATITGLLEHFKSPGLSKIISLWAELYLYLITLWTDVSKKLIQISFKSMITMNIAFAFFHPHFNKATRAMFVGIAQRTIINGEQYLSTRLDELMEFLTPIGDVMIKEFKLLFLDENKKTRLFVPENDLTWVLLNSLTSYVLKMKDVEYFKSWFEFYKILSLVLESLGLFSGQTKTLHTAKAIVVTITNFAKSPLANCFLNEPLITFYDSISPPLNYMGLDEVKSAKQNLWYYDEWWQLYRGIIEFNTILLQKFGAFMLQNGFTFVSMHLNTIKDTFKLPSITAEINALKLVCSLLNYCLLLLNWKQYWHMHNLICFQQVIEGVTGCLNCCISIILRPKIICFFTFESEPKIVPSEQVPNKRIIDIFDLIVDIVTSCCKCFINAHCHITSFLEYFGRVRKYKLVLHDFHTIGMPYRNVPCLTFGSLLCALHFLCKCTTQINLHKYAPNTFDPINATEVREKLIAFVSLNYIEGQRISGEILASVPSELPNVSSPWLCHLNEQKIQFALEALATFLAEEIYATLNTSYSDSRVAPSIRRELCSELQIFHEFIRKKTIEVHAQRDSSLSPEMSVMKSQMERNAIDYLITLSQWFIYICDLFNT